MEGGAPGQLTGSRQPAPSARAILPLFLPRHIGGHFKVWASFLVNADQLLFDLTETATPDCRRIADMLAHAVELDMAAVGLVADGRQLSRPGAESTNL